MKEISISFTEKEVATLKKLIKELDSFYDYDEEFENETENWSFEDVDAQREIALEIVETLRDKFISCA
jgi:hypothetical protein